MLVLKVIYLSKEITEDKLFGLINDCGECKKPVKVISLLFLLLQCQ